jgi:transcriptional regulator with XRE-family HTH domain
MDKRKFIGEQIRRARIPRTQKQVAAEIREKYGVHMTQRILSDLETGKRDLTAEELDAFSKYFNKPPAYFLETPEDLIKERRRRYVQPPDVLESAILSDSRLTVEQKDILLRLIREMLRE